MCGAPAVHAVFSNFSLTELRNLSNCWLRISKNASLSVYLDQLYSESRGYFDLFINSFVPVVLNIVLWI